MPQPLTIGRLAAAAEVNAETVRYYERVGLIAPPARTEGNYRSYAEGDVARLRFVRRARDLGFPLEQVRALLALSDQPGRDCGEVDRLAAAHLAEVERKLADLSALRRELSRLVASCAGGAVADCRILEAFAPADGAAARSGQSLVQALARLPRPDMIERRDAEELPERLGL